jgi:cytochrome c-type biogenesis protein CcmE
MRIKPRFLIGGGLIVAAITYLIVTGIKNTSEYYLTVDEVQAKQGQLDGQALRVAGRVKPGTISWDPAALKLQFVIGSIPQSDKGTALTPVSSPNSAQIAVTCIGQPKPDMFAENRDVIVEGKIVGNEMKAEQVLTSCPSKYDPKRPR